MSNYQVNNASKWIITIISIATIIIPSLMDLNETHLHNHLWAPHARFHFIVSYFGIAGFSITSLYLLWGKFKDKGTRVSVVIAGICPLFFWASFWPSVLVTSLDSAWPDGVEPFTLVAPQLIMGTFITFLSLYAVFLDGKKRKLNTK